MSNLRKLAELIPSEYRKEIIEMEMLKVAKAQTTDPTMQYLNVIWKNYVEPTYEPDCNFCCDRVLKNLKAMLPEMAALEKEANLLKAV